MKHIELFTEELIEKISKIKDVQVMGKKFDYCQITIGFNFSKFKTLKKIRKKIMLSPRVAFDLDDKIATMMFRLTLRQQEYIKENYGNQIEAKEKL